MPTGIKTKPFDLDAALRGEPVWHITRKLHVENVTKVGNRVAFTIPEDGETLYSCYLNGTQHGSDSFIILAMKPKTRTFYINLWNSPSSHYTKYDSLEAAKHDTRGLAPQSKSCQLHTKLNPEPIEITVEE